MNSGALTGLKVLDLSRVLAAPACTQILADFGAEVVKIERPGSGDETRQWTPPSFADGTSAYFATVNRNKKSLAVDMAKPEGAAVVRRLARSADVLVENFKVGGAAKFGLDYDMLKTANPRLVYASLTGFGQTGPDAAKPGYDYIIQGMSGLMSITGPADGLPHKVGVAVVDLFAGLQLAVGIQAALLAREKSGKGQQVDVSLFDSALAMSANVGMNCLATNTVPPRLGNEHPSIVPYRVFETAGSRHLILACGNDRQFAAVCAVMGTSWAEDGRFATNPQRVRHRTELSALMEPVLLQKDRDEWLALFEAAGIPCGPINNIKEALESPQALARGMVTGFPGTGSPVRVLGNPIHLSETPAVLRTPPPATGEHGEEILLQAGFDSEAIARLRQSGIIA